MRVKKLDITETLHRPLVTLPAEDEATCYHSRSKDALRWGGILLIEQREDLMEKEVLGGGLNSFPTR